MRFARVVARGVLAGVRWWRTICGFLRLGSVGYLLPDDLDLDQFDGCPYVCTFSCEFPCYGSADTSS
jgi:hypothetical protein